MWAFLLLILKHCGKTNLFKLASFGIYQFTSDSTKENVGVYALVIETEN